MAIQREAEVVLARWREVERELASLPEESPEAEALRSEAAVLRDEYQRIVMRIESAVAEPEPFEEVQPAT
jgi:hypothetical protein